MFRGLPLVECEHSESISQAAERVGYTPPTHRIPPVAFAQPRGGEELVAWVKAGKRSVPLPIFAKESA